MSVERRKLGEIVAEMPGAAEIFEKIQVDYCCGGNRTLKEACAARGLDLKEVVAQLEGAKQPAKKRRAPDWPAEPLSSLISHIVNNHHTYVREQLPRLEKLIAKVCSAHAERQPELLRIQKLFCYLNGELSQHLQKEERVLFPHIIDLDEAMRRNEPAPLACFDTVRSPIRMMALEHDHAGEALRAIRAASLDYQVPEQGCASYRALFEGLQAFESDLHQHIHLENNILFPRAIALEETAASLQQR